jgi:hypothetical protein
MTTSDLMLSESLPLIDDLPANLDQFVLLSRQGFYLEAEEYYSECLSAHGVHRFVLAEYVTHLIRQWNIPSLRALSHSLRVDPHPSMSDNKLVLLPDALRDFPDRVSHSPNITHFALEQLLQKDEHIELDV